jgi:hypothetical protein
MKQILAQLRTKLHNGAYCAFITKDESLKSVIGDLGYNVIDSSHVPQKNFALPASKKRKKNKSDMSGSSDCVVTIVQYKNDNFNAI